MNNHNVGSSSCPSQRCWQAAASSGRCQPLGHYGRMPFERRCRHMACQASACTSSTHDIDVDIQAAWAELERKASISSGKSMPAFIMRMIPPARRMTRFMERHGSGFAAAYQAAIEQDPIRTKALTSFAGLVIADCIAQLGEGGVYDPMRTTRMGLFGLAIHGPMGHYWYQLLDTKVMPSAGNSSAAVVAKMTADQALFAPASTMVFYAALAAMSGHLADLPSILETKLISTVVAGYALWPLAHLINFKFVPAHQRMLYINAVNLVWTVFLSRMANTPMTSPLEVSADGSMPSMQSYTSIPVSTGAMDSSPVSELHV